MFDTIFGLPVHALVIHAVVVLVPLCSAAVVVMAVSATWRERLRLPVLLLLLAAAGSSLVAKESGEALLRRLRLTGDLIGRHVTLGNSAPYIVFAFCGMYVVWFWFSRPTNTVAAATPARLKLLLYVTAAFGVFALVWVVLTGHAGSQTVWSQIVQSTNSR